MAETESPRAILQNSERPRAKTSRLIGPSDPAATLHLAIVVRSRVGSPALPDQSYWLRTPPLQRRHLSRAEFAATYGADQEDVDKVAAFARSCGFSVVEASAAKRSVIVSGTVEAANRTFGVELQQFASGGETHRGHDGPVRIDSRIAPVIEAVLGLDNRRLGRRRGGGPGGSSLTLTPTQVAQAYNFPDYNPARPQTIGIIEFGAGFKVSDVTAYVSKATGKPASPNSIVIAYGSNEPYAAGEINPGVLEALLDVDVAASVAPGATIAVYFGIGFSSGDNGPIPNEMGWYTTLSAAIMDSTHNPSVLSISFGEPEVAWPTSVISSISGLFQGATAMGITVFAASGDDGASDDPTQGEDWPGINVDYPGSDPWVTCCGGTSISQLSPLQQNTWNDGFGATGGGVSTHFTNSSQYPWQSAIRINGAAPAGRAVPDIAGNASGASGYDLIVLGTPASQTGIDGSQDFLVGLLAGTSAVAPLYAALIAIINSQFATTTSGNPRNTVGYLNPYLYQFGASNPAVYDDINDNGNNSYNGVTGYQSGPGWDACTGWGSIKGDSFALVLGVDQVPGGCWAMLSQIIKMIFQ
jgi:kumamolisin